MCAIKRSARMEWRVWRLLSSTDGASLPLFYVMYLLTPFMHTIVMCVGHTRYMCLLQFYYIFRTNRRTYLLFFLFLSAIRYEFFAQVNVFIAFAACHKRLIFHIIISRIVDSRMTRECMKAINLLLYLNRMRFRVSRFPTTFNLFN